MARRVSTLRDFLVLLERLQDKRRLFAFVLIDNKPSSIAVGEYFERNFFWLYNSAYASEMIVFLPEYSKRSTDQAFAEMLRAKNPSLLIADIFKLNADELPGIVVFTISKFKEGNGIFFPLPKDLFIQNPDEAERLLSLFFNVVKMSQSKSKTDIELFETVSEQIAKVLQDEKNTPIKKYMVNNFKKVENFVWSHIVPEISKAYIKHAFGVTQD